MKQWIRFGAVCFVVSLILHGIRSITSHSTAFFSRMRSTARMLFTVFRDLCVFRPIVNGHSGPT